MTDEDVLKFDRLIESYRKASNRLSKLVGHTPLQDFETCSEGSDSECVEPTIQKDTVSMLDHSNVDPNLLHRHKCLGAFKETILNEDGTTFYRNGQTYERTVYCTAHFAHRHPDNTVHGFLCAACVARNASESYVTLHGGIQPNNVTISKDLLPEEYDTDYAGNDEEYRKKLEEMWGKIVLDKFVSLGKMRLS